MGPSPFFQEAQAVPGSTARRVVAVTSITAWSETKLERRHAGERERWQRAYDASLVLARRAFRVNPELDGTRRVTPDSF